MARPVPGPSRSSRASRVWYRCTTAVPSPQPLRLPKSAQPAPHSGGDLPASRLRLGHLSTVLLAVACVGGASSADRIGEEALTHDRYEYTAVHMGTAVRIVVHAYDAGVAAAAARGAFDRMAVLEAILSDYQPQ